MKSILKYNFLKLVFAILLVAAAYFLNSSAWLRENVSSIAGDFEKVLHLRETHLQEEMDFLAQQTSNGNFEQLFEERINRYKALYEKEGFLFYVYEDDTLKFWSDNAVPVDHILNNSSFHSRLIRFKNGWFEVFQAKAGNKSIIGLLLIKSAYPYQNKYLVNEFHSSFNLPAEAQIIFGKGQNIQQIFTADGTELCSLYMPPEKNISGRKFLLVIFLDIAGILLFIFFLRNVCFYLEKHIRRNWAGLIFLFLLAGIRVVSIFLQLPSPFYELPLFSPGFYAASTFFPSLGDLFVNVILLFYLVYHFRSFFFFGEKFILRAGLLKKVLATVFILLLVYGCSGFCNFLIKGMVEDSSISFNVNNLFELDVYSYIGIGIIGMLFFTFFLLADKSAALIYSLELSKKALFGSLLLSTIGYFLFAFFVLHAILVHLLLPVVILAIVFLIRQKKTPGYSFANIIVIITLFAFFSAYLLSKYSSQKEYKERQVLVEKLSNDEDPVAELLYANLESRLLNDNTIQQELNNPEHISKEAIDKRLSEHYFSGYFSKYSILTYIFLNDGTPLAPVDPDKRKHKRQYFEQLLQKSGQPTISSNYHYIENTEEKENYIASFPLMDSLNSQKAGVIYITFESKLIPEEIGFPELLLDTKAKLHEDLSNYSFAKYRDDKLERQFGDYSYGMNPSAFGQSKEKYSFSELDDYSHLIYRTGNRFLVVLSKPIEGFVSSITTFSYLFAFFSLFLLLLLITRNVSRGFLFAKLNFNSKIQLLLVAVILTSLVLFGVGTSYYINKQYKEKNHKNISEKINSVLIEVEHKLGEQQALDEELKDYMAYILTKFSSVFFTDINLYDLGGNLLATSRPQLFRAGLISRKMNPSAFAQMAAKHKSEFVHDEKIGKLNYLSAYVPFKNEDGEILAYLNLPYFAKQNELENEISSFLVALINIYVFLFAISVVAALMISNFITQPLRLIQSMLSKIELGKTNKPIEYDKKDEIGILVAVYNEKVAELEISAELLAKSERESAWREMAKQVAHEIKNPLTPMKLSVQHLKKSWDDKAPGWEEKLNRFTTTVIEQIDTLSAIASEFSNFAKMPIAKKDKLNIKTVIESTIELYKDTPELDINFTSHFKKEKFVLADKDQLLRVLNNLVKNAIQAIPENRTGKIQIRLNVEEEHIIIEVEDNGTGISHEQMENIFTPNFTSKTGGMGLGLAMVKNIVENTGGKVWFETRENTGTTFYVKLPEYKEE